MHKINNKNGIVKEYIFIMGYFIGSTLALDCFSRAEAFIENANLEALKAEEIFNNKVYVIGISLTALSLVGLFFVFSMSSMPFLYSKMILSNDMMLYIFLLSGVVASVGFPALSYSLVKSD